MLLSRARNALIMIGNSKTFVNARKGGEQWAQLFSRLREGNHVYDGFPVCCERHPDAKAVLAKPQDFETECPDGGCSQPW